MSAYTDVRDRLVQAIRLMRQARCVTCESTGGEFCDETETSCKDKTDHERLLEAALSEIARLRNIEECAAREGLLDEDGALRPLCRAKVPLPILGDGSVYVDASHVWYLNEHGDISRLDFGTYSLQYIGPPSIFVSPTDEAWCFFPHEEGEDLPVIRLAQCFATEDNAKVAKARQERGPL